MYIYIYICSTIYNIIYINVYTHDYIYRYDILITPEASWKDVERRGWSGTSYIVTIGVSESVEVEVHFERGTCSAGAHTKPRPGPKGGRKVSTPQKPDCQGH